MAAYKNPKKFLYFKRPFLFKNDFLECACCFFGIIRFASVPCKNTSFYIISFALAKDFFSSKYSVISVLKVSIIWEDLFSW